eukprot:TRINITY_DN2008_c0_g1_i35.p3 TRINITY_DN2008_c0_g1~~TRINITY_DN2008_c0_g1_i35.p3  ORF type:complete len:136 (-),score=24.78 TRINITY_DN2008_c0_g1_i35:459-866(-)
MDQVLNPAFGAVAGGVQVTPSRELHAGSGHTNRLPETSRFIVRYGYPQRLEVAQEVILLCEMFNKRKAVEYDGTVPLNASALKSSCSSWKGCCTCTGTQADWLEASEAVGYGATQQRVAVHEQVHKLAEASEAVG